MATSTAVVPATGSAVTVFTDIRKHVVSAKPAYVFGSTGEKIGSPGKVTKCVNTAKEMAALFRANEALKIPKKMAERLGLNITDDKGNVIEQNAYISGAYVAGLVEDSAK